jgi:hypothetical protein
MNSTDKFIRDKLLQIAAKYSAYFDENNCDIFDFVYVNHHPPPSIHVIKDLPQEITDEIEEIFWV